VNIEPTTNQDTATTVLADQWSDGGGVLTDQRQPEPESADPDAAFEVIGSDTPTPIEAEALDGAGAVTQTAMEATANPVVREPLLTEAEEQVFLSRWGEIQVGFVEDPAASVRDADQLIDEIATAQRESFQVRRADLAADWQHGSPGTEQLRLSLRRYRAFIGVILPK